MTQLLNSEFSDITYYFESIMKGIFTPRKPENAIQKLISPPRELVV